MVAKHDWKGKSILSWPQIESQVDILAKKIRKMDFEFDKIATVTRGGLVPARLLADQFNIKEILVDEKKIPRKTLFVDDIYDSGNTYRRIIAAVSQPKQFLYATLLARKDMEFPKQLVFAKKTRGKEYVVFPWDRLEYQRIHKIKIPRKLS